VLHNIFVCAVYNYFVYINTHTCMYIKVALKGAMCNKVEYLLTEMQYDIHNYVFSGV